MKKMITADDLSPGQMHSVRNQGMAITPRTIIVTIHWVGPNAVHYLKENDPTLHEASLEYFLETINQ